MRGAQRQSGHETHVYNILMEDQDKDNGKVMKYPKMTFVCNNSTEY